MKQQKDIEKIVDSIKTKDLRADEKRFMWSQIDQATPAHVSARSGVLGTNMTQSMMKKIIAVAVLFSLTGATAYASNGAGPGDILFPVDRMVEEVRLSIASGDKKNELRLQMIEERLDEIDRMIQEKERNRAASSSTNATTSATSTDDDDDGAERDRERAQVERGLNLAISILNAIENTEGPERGEAVRAVISEINERANMVEATPGNERVRVRVEKEDDDGERIRVRIEKDEDDGDARDDRRRERIEIRDGRIEIVIENDDDDDDRDDDERDDSSDEERRDDDSNDDRDDDGDDKSNEDDADDRDDDSSNATSSDDTSFEVEVDVFSDLTVIKIEENDNERYITTDATEREAIIDEVVAETGKDRAEVEAVIEVEIEDRESRSDDRGEVLN